jgi:integrase
VYGTPLKNGADGERIVNISPDLTTLLENYLDHHRDDVLDTFDRKPLITTPQGRIARTTIRRDYYKLTRPCVYDGDCPHDRSVDRCEATHSEHAASCPSNYTTHPLRKWSIMNQLQEGMPKELLSDRVDVSVPILDKHYDHRSEERKSAQRQRALEANISQYRRSGSDTCQ